jgi:hypothetical protein
LNTTIANLSKMVDNIKERQKAQLKQSIIVQEWAAKHVAGVVAGAAGDDGKYQKAVSKQRFPWKEFGFPEMVGDEDYKDEDDTEYFTPKPPPPYREDGEDPAFDYILGDGNMKGAMRDNRHIGNLEMAVASTIAR